MIKTFKLLAIICVFILFISGISCASKTTTSEARQQVIPVQRGNLTITVPVDGNLVMPQAFDLHFGAPGNVQDVLVEEGDHVKAGTIMATLDDTAERLDIASANNAVQTVLSNLYETVPRLPQFPSTFYDANVSPWTPWTIPVSDSHVYFTPPETPSPTPTLTPTITYTTRRTTPGTTVTTKIETTVTWAVNFPFLGTTTVTTSTRRQTQTTTVTTRPPDSILGYPFYYPNSATLSSFAWTQDEVTRAHELFQSDNYTAAASELYVAQSDLEACLKIIEDAINNPASGLGGIAPLIDQDKTSLFAMGSYAPLAVVDVMRLQELVEQIKQGQADLKKAQTLITQGNYMEAGPIFGDILSRMKDIQKAIIANVNLIEKRDPTTIYGKDISLYFYNVAEEKMNAALKGLENGGLNSLDLDNNLRIAQHYMEICNAILGSNDLVLQHGLSLKNQRQYNIDLQKSLVSLEDKKQDFLDTVILAPFDGTVVSVSVKKNDVLSPIDYSSKGTIQLVDTSQIKFQGLVDEIDILKVKTGQKATISVDAVPNKTFTGTVSFISAYGTADTSNVVKFNVTILLDPTDVELKGGLTATANIAISNIENALLVPVAAITTSTAGSFATVINEATGQTEKRQVTLGGQNQQFAEVLSGLKEGDKVIFEEKVSGAPVSTPMLGPPHEQGGGGRGGGGGFAR
jgi:multidrug efflux pump subunit AcrA (membrane-fusion protein)